MSKSYPMPRIPIGLAVATHMATGVRLTEEKARLVLLKLRENKQYTFDGVKVKVEANGRRIRFYQNQGE
jgi:hypothetical protein